VPSPALGGIGCLLQPRAGPRAEVTFLRSFGGDGFKPGSRAPASAAWPDSWKRILIFRLASSMLPWRPLPGVTGLTGIATLGHLAWEVNATCPRFAGLAPILCCGTEC
jgi:hypothetical protein